jgi:hypothetical protein
LLVDDLGFAAGVADHDDLAVVDLVAVDEAGYGHGRALAISGEQAPGRSAKPRVSHVGIDYRRIGDPRYPTDESLTRPPGVVARGSLPVEWPPLPAVGEPICSFNDFEVAPGHPPARSRRRGHHRHGYYRDLYLMQVLIGDAFDSLVAASVEIGAAPSRCICCSPRGPRGTEARPRARRTGDALP